MYENSLFDNLNFQGQMKVNRSNLIIGKQSYENDSCLRTMLISKFFPHSALFSLFPSSVSFKLRYRHNGKQGSTNTTSWSFFWLGFKIDRDQNEDLDMKQSLALLQPNKSTNHSQNYNSGCGTTDCIEQR